MAIYIYRQLEFTVVVATYPVLILRKGPAHGRVKQFGERIMVSGPTSRAVGRLKKKKKTKSRFCRFPYLTLTVLAMLGYFMDKRPLQKHSILAIQKALESKR